MASRTTIMPGVVSPHDTLVARGATLVASTPDERAELLDETEWSRRFSWKQLQCLAWFLRRYQVAAGKTLFKEGDHDAFLAIVLEGSLEIRKHDLGENGRVVAVVRRGKLVGEMSLLDGTARSASAIAAEPTDLLILTKRDFHELGREHPTMGFELTLAIATAIAQLLRATTGALVEHLGD
jgi:hypothetical protein